MELSCHLDPFKAAWTAVSGACGKGTNLKPALLCVRAVADLGTGLTLTATDLEVAVSLAVEGVEVRTGGVALLPDKVGQILREIVGPVIVLSDENGLAMVGQGSDFTLPQQNPDEFPSPPAFEADAPHHTIPADVLREMLGRTAFAAADDGQRYAMTGVMWELDGDHVRLVATDGKRLSVADGAASAVGGHATKGTFPVVPKKAVGLLSRLLSGVGEDEPVSVVFRANEVLFRVGGAVMYSRLVEGRFPDYRAVLKGAAEGTAGEADVPAAALLATVKQAAIMTEGGDEGKRLSFEFAPGGLTVRGKTAEKGRSQSRMPLDYRGKPIDINLDPTFLTDFLKEVGAGEVNLRLRDGGSPALFRCGEGFAYMVMPLT